jgi:hypothetical protein
MKSQAVACAQTTRQRWLAQGNHTHGLPRPQHSACCDCPLPTHTYTRTLHEPSPGAFNTLLHLRVEPALPEVADCVRHEEEPATGPPLRGECGRSMHLRSVEEADTQQCGLGCILLPLPIHCWSCHTALTHGRHNVLNANKSNTNSNSSQLTAKLWLCLIHMTSPVLYTTDCVLLQLVAGAGDF